ncbi:MAG: CoA transferase [Dehalococcoidia bacterium]|nr:CoA transferase [Dehalococcoidia bacterium]
MQALEGIRVVDLSTLIAGPSCTKLLADFGADVIKVEPPAGDPARAIPPFAKDEPGLERSLLFLHLNTNKRSVTIDPHTEQGASLLRQLIATADVVVESGDPGELEALGLGYEELAADHPSLVYASITPWGQTGPYAAMGVRASEITLQAMGGPMNATGSPEREPLKLGGYTAQLQAGSVAAYGIAAAMLRAEAIGEGDHLDVSIYETQAGTRDRRTSSLTSYFYQGTVSQRQLGGVALASGVRPAADGHFNLIATGAGRLKQFVDMIGRPDLMDDPRLDLPAVMMPPEFVEEVAVAYLVWAIDKPKREVVAEAQRRTLLSGAVNTPADLLDDPHYRERGTWEVVDHPSTGPVEYPGRPFIMSQTPRQPARRAPLLGEHNVEVLGELGVAHEDLPLLRATGVI